MDTLMSQLIKETLADQHYQSLLEEAERERLIRRARETRSFVPIQYPRKEVKTMLKRKLAYLFATVIIVALYIAQAAQAAAGGGGGGGLHLVM